jgi:hypothetical protein
VNAILLLTETECDFVSLRVECLDELALDCRFQKAYGGVDRNDGGIGEEKNVGRAACGDKVCASFASKNIFFFKIHTGEKRKE